MRGQFRGYRDEDGVAPDSQVETFAAVRLHIDTWRWAGVPFYIRAGKRLPFSATEVVVELKHPPQTVFDEIKLGESNYLHFRLSPMSLSLFGRGPRCPENLWLAKGWNLVACQHFGDEMSPYERLLATPYGATPLYSPARTVLKRPGRLSTRS